MTYKVVGSVPAPRLAEASGEWKTINVCLKNSTLSEVQGVTGNPVGHVPMGYLVVPDNDNTDGCYSIVDINRVRIGHQDLREVGVLVQDVYDLHLGDKDVAIAVEAIWTKDRLFYNGPAMTAAEKDLFHQRIIERWDGI